MDSLSKLVEYSQTRKHVQTSISIVEKALSMYRVENTCLSFNGGKDCTAVLHLVHSIASKYAASSKGPCLSTFYAQLPNHFSEESVFVHDTVKRYNLKLLQYSASTLKDSLGRLKSDAPHIEAIFIGTRRDDFDLATKMEPFEPTDRDWPSFMRINPILDWTYSQVWDFIRELKVPYCDLYNQGYSSLGTKDNTVKNSSLLKCDDSGKAYYMPAWHLVSSREERFSRSASQDMAGNKNP